MTIKDQDIIEPLNIADRFTLAMDEEIRQEGLSGSYGCLALELDGMPDVQTLQQRIDELTHRFPTVTASLQQQGRHFYWFKRKVAPTLFFQHHQHEVENQIEFHQLQINLVINHTESRETLSPIEFHLISSPSKFTFFTRWMHPFCDAKGADIILKFLCTEDYQERQSFGKPETEPLVNIQLAKYPWWQKIGLFLKAKRYIDKLDKLTSIQTFTNKSKPQSLTYSVKRLSTHETEQALKQAKQQIGLTGTSLYYIGCLMRALDKLNPNSEGQAFCSPYAFNLRKQRALSPVTANHVCALFSQAPREIVKDRKQLFSFLKQSQIDVIRQQQDYAFLPLMWAGSWLSLKEYGETLRLSTRTKTERSSFWFSDIGKLEMSRLSFPGANIDAVFHICHVTSPPAFAFLSCIYNNQLTLSYNFVKPIVSQEQIDELHQLVLAELLAEPDTP